ncbi:hypothetical protein WUBG_04745 [Wuchereria bancrofti]|uniref:TOG domain-containing protein n=1 Tax=Wuchereria bancrofti TaxID=6293 RepID=J9BB25_WUCBA|nr:hypothetical protein WUBG_04745 [Wuchereria bancrofti]
MVAPTIFEKFKEKKPVLRDPLIDCIDAVAASHNPQTVPKKVLKLLAPIIVKLTSDSDPEVRDASYAALGAAMKAVGEKSCMVLLADIAEEKVKMAKIRDFCEKALQEAGTDVVSIMVQSMHKSNPLKPPAPGVGNSNVGEKTRSKEVVNEDNTEEKSSKTTRKEFETAKGFN